MSTARKIKKIITGKSAIDGAGVKLTRVFGHTETEDFNPFLMLDAFDSTDARDYIKGFPWHPHRGMETITYLIEGRMEHGDNLGNSGIIEAGDCQWMTAGSGIIHQEMPLLSTKIFGAQLWLNLPASSKMTAPSYRDIRKKDIPVIHQNGTTIRIISGAYLDTVGGFIGNYVNATYLDIEISPGHAWSYSTVPSDTLFIYILSGIGTFDEDKAEIANKHATLFTSGEILNVCASEKGIRFLLLSASPLLEPIAWGGPIVMNTTTELEQAFQELNQGTFIKKNDE